MEKSEKEQGALRCTICGKSTTLLVDGEASCNEHLDLVYEHQLEDYTKEHLVHNEYLEP